MNIFVLSEDPTEAARMMCDKHIPKMVVETMQMLGSAVIRHGAQPDDMPLTSKGTPLKGGYHFHPCSRWAATRVRTSCGCAITAQPSPKNTDDGSAGATMRVRTPSSICL